MICIVNIPDWAIQVPGYEHTYSRNQLVLNLANPQVVEYLKNVLDQLLSYHEIDYIKWDMNRNMTNLGNGFSLSRDKDAISSVYVGALQTRFLSDRETQSYSL